MRALRTAVCEAAARAADAVTIHLNGAVATTAAAATVVLSPSLASSLSSPTLPSNSPPLLVCNHVRLLLFLSCCRPGAVVRINSRMRLLFGYQQTELVFCGPSLSCAVGLSGCRQRAGPSS